MNKYEIFLVNYISEKNSIDTESINISSDIFENAYIDSIGLFTLFVELEEEFDIDISLDSIKSSDVATIKSFAKFLGSIK